MNPLAKATLALATLLFSTQMALADVVVMAADRAYEAATNGKIVIVDVRTPEEWARSGVPRGAIAIDMRSPEFIGRLRSLFERYPGKSVAMICARGVRSTRLTTELEKHGFSDLINIREGMFGSSSGPGWFARELPVSRK